MVVIIFNFTIGILTLILKVFKESLLAINTKHIIFRLKKNIFMKKIFTLICAILISLSFTVSAQTQGDYNELARTVLKAEKQATVAEAMILTEEESAPFWELYNEYQNELYKLGSEELKIITDYAKNFESLNDQKADELWTAAMNLESIKLKLKKKYYKKFKKIIPSGKAARFFQIENKIEALISAQMALEIPVIDVK